MCVCICECVLSTASCEMLLGFLELGALFVVLGRRIFHKTSVPHWVMGAGTVLAWGCSGVGITVQPWRLLIFLEPMPLGE